MSNWLSKFGAKPSKDVRYGVLWNGRFSTGQWSQRSPLRDAGSTRIEEEFYGARGDALLSGLNCEVSPRLTFIRRPGSSVYNSQTFPGINRFYEFAPVIDNQEQIHVIADVRGPSNGVTMSVSGMQVIQTGTSPFFIRYLLATFTSAVPTIITSQTYTFTGLTGLSSLNSLALIPLATGSFPSIIVPGANQAVFNVSLYASSSYGPAADTGQALAFPASGSPTVRDVTGPNTNQVLWNKNPNAKTTSFQGVGNTLYFSDGINANKLVKSATVWKSNTSYSSGQFIVDPNGNLQLAVGSQTATITDIQIASGTCTVFFAPGTSLDVPVGAEIFPTGLSTVTALNGTTQVSTGNSNSQQVQFANAGSQVFTAETGLVTTGTGFTGAAQPVWFSSLGGITQDGGAQWVCRGPQVETWGINTPSVTPTVTQAALPSSYPAWTANTWYSPLFVILDGNGNLQQLTSVGSAPHQTGGTTPTWSIITGGTTTDGDITWTCLGAGAWAANTAYAVGKIIQASFTYYITQTVQDGYNPYTQDPNYVTVQYSVTVSGIFQCIIAGTSGPLPGPSWSNGFGTTTVDNNVTWINRSGPSIPGWPGATQILSLTTAVLDSNDAVETITALGKSGATAPTWGTSVGSYTSDNTAVWQNTGPFGQANTGSWIYAYSYKNSITGHVGTASQQSSPILVSAGNLAVIQGSGSSDSQVDSIVIWRTVQGGSSLFYLDEISNPGGGATWTYTDTTPDTGLNEFISAPIDGVNNPPPVGLLALTYHLGRIWGAVNNLVYFSTGPDVTAGNGNEAWSASNVFAFPDTVTRLFPTASGLMVFTIADIYIIQGLGTASSALFSAPFLQDIGLVSYDAFSINGSIVYLYTSDNQILTLDPSSGVSEIGFPIGDQFGPGLGTGTFSPSTACVSWHVAGSQDKGLYVSDFQGTWWRMTPTPSPESGTTWSPKAQVVGGFSAVQSVEVIPGTHELLMGPKTSGPILKRDYTTFSDNGSSYNSWAILGSMVLAQPGQLAAVESFTSDSMAVGAPISLAVQLDEIAPYFGLQTMAIANPGANYRTGDIVAAVYPGASGGLAKVTGVSGSGAVSTLALIAPGEGYQLSSSALPTTGGTGSGLTVNTTAINYFEPLTLYVPDPTQLEPSVSTYAQRFYLSQTQKPAVCRHLQVLINWGTDVVKNELLSLSLFGSFDQEK